MDGEPAAHREVFTAVPRRPIAPRPIFCASASGKPPRYSHNATCSINAAPMRSCTIAVG